MQKPYCLAMLLCDACHIDPTTRKRYVLGTFSGINAPSFPMACKLVVFFEITDGLGKSKIKVRLVDSDFEFDRDDEDNGNKRVIFEWAKDIDFPNPLTVVSDFLPVEVIIHKPGMYLCELLANDKVLMSRHVVAQEIATKEDK